MAEPDSLYTRVGMLVRSMIDDPTQQPLLITQKNAANVWLGAAAQLFQDFQ